MTRAPLPRDDWAERWLALPTWSRLHRVAEIAYDDGERIRGEGVTVCGRAGYLMYAD